MGILSRVVQSLRAKLNMQKAGVRVAQPRNKKETWGIKVADAEFWQAFEVIAAAMDFAQFLARLKTEKANGKVSAQAMIEKYAPDMARFLKAQPDDVWNKPINAEIPEWRDSLHTKIAGALVKNDEPVLPGKLPVRPSEFRIDPDRDGEAKVAVEKWRCERKRHGLECGAGKPSLPSSTIVCPPVAVTISCSDSSSLHGTLITSSSDISTIVLSDACAGSFVFPASVQRFAPDDDDLLTSVPEWAQEYVIMKLESDSGVAEVIVLDDGLVVLDERDVTAAQPELDDAPAVDGSVALCYTAIVTAGRLSIESPAKAVGTSVSGIQVAILSCGTPVALLARQMNEAQLVIEAGADATDHYVIPPTDAGDSAIEMSEATGVVQEFCQLSDSYAAYKIGVAGSLFWLPVSLFATGPHSDNEPPSNESKGEFGQIGADFYCRLANGNREHVDTTLRKCQTWIDHVSHNRSERFRVKRSAPPGDLMPLHFYARIENAGTFADVVFRIFTLDKLVKVADGYSTWLPSAAFGAADVEVQWTEYELVDGLYVRTARQSDQQKLGTSMQIAMQVQIDEVEGVSGGSLNENSTAALLAMGLVSEHASGSVREIGVVLPPRESGAAKMAPLAFDNNRRLTGIEKSVTFSGSPAAGDILLSINGAHCEAASDARAQLRRAVSGDGRFFLRVWTPPDGWTPPSAVREPDDDEGIATAASESLPQWTEGEMKCAVRLSCRMIGGMKEKANVVAMCRALEVPADGSKLVLQRRLEQELRDRNVHNTHLRAYDRAGVLKDLPSQREVVDRTHEQINETYDGTVFNLAQIVELLRLIPREPPDGASGVIAPGHSSAATPASTDDTPRAPLFVDFELSAIPAATAVVSFGDQTPVSCLPSTGRVIRLSDREQHEFFERIIMTIGEGRAQTFCRTRSLADDACPVFEHDGDGIGLVRLRVTDISRDSDGKPWLHGFPLYSKSQLPSSTVAALAPAFDPNSELVEGIDLYQVDASTVRGIVRVLSSASASLTHGDGPVVVDATCHQAAAFVEEFPNGKWKVTKPKFRPEAGSGRRGARAR